jgi:transcription-repair coupling factor (superfamily II helicase)
MEMYKKIALITDEQDRDDILDEFLDRYGDIPRATENLLGIALVRADAIRCGIKQLRQEASDMQIYPEQVDFEIWSALSAAFPSRLRMALTGDPHLNVRMKKGEDILEFLHKLFTKYIELAAKAEQEANAPDADQAAT